MRGLHEQSPHVFVAALGYLAQDRAVPSRLLLRYKPQPGGEIAPLLETGAVADRRHHRTRDDRADTRNAHEPLAALVLLCHRFDLVRHGGNAFVQSAPVLDQLADEIDHSWRQRVGIRAQNFRQRLAQWHEALPHGDAALKQKAADLIGHTRALADQARAHAMQCQQIHLLRRLDRHEVHRWSLHRSRDRFRVAVVILVSLEERLYVLRWDQTHIVTKSRKLSSDKMGARTGFHPDEAARNIAQPASKLMTGYLLLQNNRTPNVEPYQMERVLADVDADRADGFLCVLRCAHRMLLHASRQRSSRLTAEHGRAIPLAEFPEQAARNKRAPTCSPEDARSRPPEGSRLAH